MAHGPEPSRQSKIGLALAGGGPEGAVYEIGVLRALEEALEAIDFNDLHVYVGVSAGAFVGANLANGLSPLNMCRALVTHPFVPQTFLTPAVGEFVRRSLKVPKLLLEAIWEHASGGGTESLWSEALLHLSGALPVALFESEPIRRYLHSIYTEPGRTDDFRRLKHQLVVVAADLDSGQAVRFGAEGYDHVPISKAVQASVALPGLYPPVMIDGRYYVDGVLLKTLHASVALEAGSDLVICINPIVPVDMAHQAAQGALNAAEQASLFERGLPIVLSQTFRTLIHSRLTVGLSAYTPRYPDRDIVLFEPPRDDYRMFFTNIFGFSSRRAICAHAYRSTRRDLLERYDELAPLFAKHGLRLCREVLEDASRDAWAPGLAPNGESVSETLDGLLSRLEVLVAQEEARLGGPEPAEIVAVPTEREIDIAAVSEAGAVAPPASSDMNPRAAAAPFGSGRGNRRAASSRRA